MTTILEIRLGNLIVTCLPDNLLNTLRGAYIWQAIKNSMTRVRVMDADTEEELADIWYDASIAHKEGEDWGTLSAKLADATEAALRAKAGQENLSP